jgi:hypothetical protein
MPQAHRKPKDTSQTDPGRNAERRSSHRHAALWKSGLRILISGALLAGLHWAVPHFGPMSILRRVPHSVVGILSAAAATTLGLFLIVEVTLLVGAAVTISNPKLHERFKALMIFWPTALVMPFAIIINRKLQRQLLADHASDIIVHQTTREHKRRRGSHHNIEPTKETQGEPSNTNPHLLGREDVQEPREHAPPEAILDDYRRAMALLIRRAEQLQQDQDLLNLCLRLLTSPEVMKEINHQSGELQTQLCRLRSLLSAGGMDDQPRRIAMATV